MLIILFKADEYKALPSQASWTRPTNTEMQSH